MGAIWRDVLQTILQVSRTGLVAVAGGCLGVGAGGFLLGGGYSFVSRSYGLGIDNVLSLTLVRRTDRSGRSGRSRRALTRICSGRHAAAAAATSASWLKAKLKLHRPNKPNVLAGQILFPFYRIDDILPAYNKWVSSLPDEMRCTAFSATSPTRRTPARRRSSCASRPCSTAQFAEGMSLLQPLFKLQPSSVSLYSMTLPEFEAMAGASTSVSGRGAYIPLGAAGARDDGREARGCLQSATCPACRRTSRSWCGHTPATYHPQAAGRHGLLAPNSLFMPEVKAIWDANQPQDARRVDRVGL